MSEAVKKTFQTRRELEQLLKDYQGKIEADPEPGEQRAAYAALLYAAGRFDAAAKEARAALSSGASPSGPLHILAKIQYLLGRYARASELFEQALWAEPASAELVWDLAQCYLQQNDYRRAGELLQRHGSPNPALPLIQKVAERPPFALVGGRATTVVRLLRTDPLPVIKVKVNGKPVFAFLDTGGPGVTTNLAYARQEGYPFVSSQSGDYALRRQAPVEMLVVDSVSMGDFRIENMPGYALEGIRPKFDRYTCEFSLGTGLLKQFLATIDYPRKRLILTRRDVRGARTQHLAMLGKTVARVPFFMAESHFLLVRGSLNGRQGLVFFVDSGLAAFGRPSPRDPVHQAACMLPFQSLEGFGIAAGSETEFPYFYKVDSLAVGRLIQADLYGFTKDREQAAFKFGGILVDGLVSHTFLRNLCWTIDWDKHEFIFTR